MSHELPQTTSDTIPIEKARVVSIVALDARDDASLLALAASLAPRLDRALADAIAESTREREIEVGHVQQLHEPTNIGVAGVVAGHTVVLGNAILFADLGLCLGNLADWSERLQERGQHVLFIAIDGCTAGFIGVVDSNS